MASLLSGATALSIGAIGADARACSGAVCNPGGTVPGNGAIVPANLPALAWEPTRSGGFDPRLLFTADGGVADPGDASVPLALRLTAATGAPIPLGLAPLSRTTVLLVPDSELVPGVVYTFHDAGACVNHGEGGLADNFTFTAAAAAPLPTALGNLSVSETTTEPLGVAAGASCSDVVTSVQAQVSVSFSSSAIPWKDAFVYSTWVDGKAWFPSANISVSPRFGESWRGRGEDLVYAACEQKPDAALGLEQGTHTVQIRVALPGTELDLRTNTVSVTLRCPGRPDASVPAGASSDNCNCRIGHSGGRPSGMAAALGVLCLSWFGRRRRATSAR